LTLPEKGPEKTVVSLERKKKPYNRIRTAHFTPTIQLPPRISPFFRTALIASAGSEYPILKQLRISVLRSGSVDVPSDWKYSTVTLYLSAGYPKTTT
jgi:hypothetical protein